MLNINSAVTFAIRQYQYTELLNNTLSAPLVWLQRKISPIYKEKLDKKTGHKRFFIHFILQYLLQFKINIYVCVC